MLMTYEKTNLIAMPKALVMHVFISSNRLLNTLVNRPDYLGWDKWDMRRAIVEEVAKELGAFWEERMDKMAYMVRPASYEDRIGYLVTLSTIVYDQFTLNEVRDQVEDALTVLE